MMRRAPGILAAGSIAMAIAGSCSPPVPKPLDVSSYPSAVTSAEPLFISNAPSAGASASTQVPSVPSAIPPAPISGDLPDYIDVAFERTASCLKATCTLLMTALPGDDPSKPGASAPDHGSLPAPVVAWQHKIGPKATLLFPLASDVSVLGVVLKGSVSLTAIEGGNAKVLAPWGSFVAPSAGLKLQALDSEASVVLAVVTNPASFVRPATASQAKPIPPKKREAPLAVEDLRTCRDLSWAGGAAHARLGFEADRSLRASLGILLMSSDMPMSEHAHASGWEVSITLRAKGMLMLPGRQVSVGPGMTVVVPNATTHSWLPGGSEPFLAIQLYLPPGPEQRFKALASEGTH